MFVFVSRWMERWLGICCTYYNCNRSVRITRTAHVIGNRSFSHYQSISWKSLDCWYGIFKLWPQMCSNCQKFHKCVQLCVFIGLIGSLSMAVGLMVSPVTITLCRRKSTRLLAVIGGLVLTLGCLFTSFAQQYHQVMFSYGKSRWIRIYFASKINNGNPTNQFVGGIFIASKGIVVGLGVGMTRDCTIIMIAQYFKKRREFVEVVTVAGSGLGIIVMSTFIQKSIDALGWR